MAYRESTTSLSGYDAYCFEYPELDNGEVEKFCMIEIFKNDYVHTFIMSDNLGNYNSSRAILNNVLDSSLNM